MKFFTKLLREAAQSFGDPDRDARRAMVEQVVRNAWAQARQTRVRPNFDQTRAGLPDPGELAEIQQAVCREVVQELWQRPRFTPQELREAEWAAICLEVPHSTLLGLHRPFLEARVRPFVQHWLRGRLADAQAAAGVDYYATLFQTPRAALVRSLAIDDVRTFLVAGFEAAIADRRLTRPEWDGLVAQATQLGASVDELKGWTRAAARRHLEHVLVDIQAGDVFSEQEEAHVLWLLRQLEPGPDYAQYVGGVVALNVELRTIRQGRLPNVVPPPGLAVDAGEIVHFHGPASWWEPRRRGQEIQYAAHQGTLAITDARLIFLSPSKSSQIRLASIVLAEGDAQSIKVQPSNKAASVFTLEQPRPQVRPILATAIGRLRRTATAAPGERATRHIPQEVRNRVWQRDGGQCVDCGAAEYLEFDHVIPFSRGGSSDENNLQILCRRCNSAKRDRI